MDAINNPELPLRTYPNRAAAKAAAMPEASLGRLRVAETMASSEATKVVFVSLLRL